MNVVIDSKLIGSQKHLLCSSDGFSKIEKIEEDFWHFNGNVKQLSNACFDTLLKLNFCPRAPEVPQKYVNSMNVVAKNAEIYPWSMILPKDQYRNYFNDLVGYVKQHENVDSSYYTQTWVLGNSILNSIKPVKTDGNKISEIVSSSAINSQVIESFRPRSGGYASHVVYDRFGTVTGRLTVSSGPNILLLKKDYRQILKPSHPDGRIVSLDFSSLEARILLYESGKDCLDFDLYEMLSKRFGSLPRQMVKAAVLSVLYGSSKSSVALHLGVSEDKIAKLILQIEEYIDTRSLLKKLKKEHKETGHIKNKFGRKIPVDRVQDNIFINYYAQSTGVDVSLMGFSKIVETLGTNGIRPIFVLHDALLLDVHPDRLQDVSDIRNVNVLGYDQAFPVKFEEISR